MTSIRLIENQRKVLENNNGTPMITLPRAYVGNLTNIFSGEEVNIDLTYSEDEGIKIEITPDNPVEELQQILQAAQEAEVDETVVEDLK